MKAVIQEPLTRKTRQCKENYFKKSQTEAKSNRLNTSNVVQKEDRYLNMERRTKRSSTLQRSNISEEMENFDSDNMTDISCSSSKDEYLPPVTRATRAKESVKSVNYAAHKKNVKTPKLRKQISVYKVCHDTTKNKNKTMSRQLTIKLKALKSKRFKRNKNIQSDYAENKCESSQLQVKSDAARTFVKVDIPSSLSEDSKTRLKKLAAQV